MPMAADIEVLGWTFCNFFCLSAWCRLLLCHITESLNFFLSVTSSLFNKIIDIDVYASYSLLFASIWIYQIRCTVSYLHALPTRFQKRLNTNYAIRRMPRSQIVLCTVPHIKFAFQRILVSILRIVWLGIATVPAFVFPQFSIRSSWW